MNRRQTRDAFTLIELLAVLAVLAVLITIGSKGLSYARREAKESRARADLEKIRLALEEFRAEYGRYPDQPAPVSIRDLGATGFLTNAVEGLRFRDPWGRDYLYRSDGRYLYTIRSMGRDAESGADDLLIPDTEK